MLFAAGSGSADKHKLVLALQVLSHAAYTTHNGMRFGLHSLLSLV